MHYPSKVLRVTGKLQPQRTGGRALSLSRIRALVVEPVALPDAVSPRRAEFLSGNCARSYQEQSAYSRRNVVDYVIKVRGRSPEPHIPVVPVADHRIHRIYRFVRKPQNRPADRRVYHRRHDTIREVLSDRLNCRFGHSLFIEHSHIPSDDHGHSLPRRRRIAREQSLVDMHALAPQARHRQEVACQHRLDDDTEDNVRFIRKTNDDQCNECGDHDHAEHQHRSGALLIGRIPELAVRVICRQPAEQHAVERAYQVPDPPDRMRHPVRVAYYEIKHEPCRKSDHMCLQQ